MTIFDSIRYPINEWSDINDNWNKLPFKIREEYYEWHNSILSTANGGGEVYMKYCVIKMRELISKHDDLP